MISFREWQIENDMVSKLVCTEAVNYVELTNLYRKIALRKFISSQQDALTFLQLSYGIVAKSLSPDAQKTFENVFNQVKEEIGEETNS